MWPGRGGPTASEGEKISEERRPRWALLGGGTILFLLALVKLLVHLLTAGNYGYFRDELYYIAASERLDLGYVDFPPFVALATALARATLGDSLLALDLLPALAGTAVVVLAGLFAGLGLLTKLTMLSFGFAVLVALLLTPARRHLLSPWPWISGAIAIAFLAPYVYWNATNGWPTPEFWGEYGGEGDEAPPVGVLIEQIVTIQPPPPPRWLPG